VILQAHLAAGKKIRDRRDGLFRALGAGTHYKNQITQRKSGPRRNNLMAFAHIVAISPDSNSDAIIVCEYPIHCPSGSYSIVMHKSVDHRATLLFNFRT
jgi:hypothetical protein